MPIFSSSKVQRKPARSIHDYTWKELCDLAKGLLISLLFLVVLTVPVASLMSGTQALLWDLRGHLPLLSFSPEQWFYGPSFIEAVWLAAGTILFWLGSFVFGCKWLLWSGFQYGFRNSALTNKPVHAAIGAFRPLPPQACPPGTSAPHQELRCLITFITGFLAYAWFVIASVVGSYLCSAARAMDMEVTSLSMSRLLWWRQAFPEHWPPNLVLEVLCLYVLSLTLIWSGYAAGRAAALTPAQNQP